MEQLLSDLALIRDGLLDTTAGLWVPLTETVATMPTWAIAAAGAGALALIGVLPLALELLLLCHGLLRPNERHPLRRLEMG